VVRAEVLGHVLVLLAVERGLVFEQLPVQVLIRKD
jgi:hypothetical protein